MYVCVCLCVEGGCTPILDLLVVLQEACARLHGLVPLALAAKARMRVNGTSRGVHGDGGAPPSSAARLATKGMSTDDFRHLSWLEAEEEMFVLHIERRLLETAYE